MLESFTGATFHPRVGEGFRIHGIGSSPLDVVLVEVTEAAEPWRDGGRTPFAIVFRGPLGPVLPQRIYTMDNPHLGSFDLFLVPLGPDEEGMRYEAVFT